MLVHDGTVYVYTGHDEAPPGVERFVMRDWLCFSSTDLLTWHAHGPLLRVDQFAWARDGAKAGAVVERDGRFFWYVAVNHATVDGGAIGVAVADQSHGPVPRRARVGARHQRRAVRRPATTTRSTRRSSCTTGRRTCSGARNGASRRGSTTR